MKEGRNGEAVLSAKDDGVIRGTHCNISTGLIVDYPNIRWSTKVHLFWQKNIYSTSRTGFEMQRQLNTVATGSVFRYFQVRIYLYPRQPNAKVR